MSKTVYQTDQYGIYTGPITADESPLEPGQWLIPAGCVEVEPPAPGEHQVPHWNGKRWQLVRSFQGLTAYNTATGEPLQIHQVGELPPGYTLSVPGPGQIWRNGEWLDDPALILSQLYAEKIEAINTACAQFIQGGFDSHALGERFRYPSTLEDQVNLSGLVLAGLDADVACYGADQVKTYRPHTFEQLHAVGLDLVRFKQSALRQADTLKKELDTARQGKKIKAMKAVTWTVPA
ncbi:phage tail protein [Pseudomonas protegens]|uniref:DUF4376 domain-containing protein n=1 Tax=Pseudomonas protegens TaxID=380021 RepID=UPI0037FC802D